MTRARRSESQSPKPSNGLNAASGAGVLSAIEVSTNRWLLRRPLPDQGEGWGEGADKVIGGVPPVLGRPLIERHWQRHQAAQKE